jgi:DNA-directed RNA polymerase subunit RPC12/RpoP
MNFQSIKSMIESLVKTYKCPECSEWITEANVDIIWAAWSTINIDIECSYCGKHSMLKTEILALNLTDKWISAENIEKLKSVLLKNWNIKAIKEKSINDEQIVWLNKDLKKWKLNVSDLLG